MLMRFTLAATALALAVSSAAAGGATASVAGIEGHWTNPKRTTVVRVSQCARSTYCAIVLKATAKAQANARKGGTEHFIGTEILHVSSAGNGVFKGKAFDPESNLHIPATVRFVDAGTIEIQGCALLGLICKTQRWTKVD